MRNRDREILQKEDNQVQPMSYFIVTGTDENLKKFNNAIQEYARDPQNFAEVVVLNE